MSFDTQAIDALKDKPSSHFQLTTTELYNKILKRDEAELTELGAINAKTGVYTGRSPKDKYIVDNPQVKDDIDWGTINQPISEEKFLNLYYQVIDYLDSKDEIFVFNGYAGSDKDSQLDLTVVNEFAWHNLFAQNLFIKPNSKEEAAK